MSVVLAGIIRRVVYGPPTDDPVRLWDRSRRKGPFRVGDWVLYDWDDYDEIRTAKGRLVKDLGPAVNNGGQPVVVFAVVWLDGGPLPATVVSSQIRMSRVQEGWKAGDLVLLRRYRRPEGA